MAQKPNDLALLTGPNAAALRQVAMTPKEKSDLAKEVSKTLKSLPSSQVEAFVGAGIRAIEPKK